MIHVYDFSVMLKTLTTKALSPDSDFMRKAQPKEPCGDAEWSHAQGYCVCVAQLLGTHTDAIT